MRVRSVSVISLLFSALFSAQAFACPNLTGAFTCTHDDRSTEVVTITQELKNGVTVYSINGSSIPADNVPHPRPDDESTKQAVFRAWCDGASLKGNIIGKYYHSGTYFGDLDVTNDVSIEAGTLKMVTTGTLKDTHGRSYPLDSNVVCPRN